jgi:ETC complex I subunit conserved region
MTARIYRPKRATVQSGKARAKYWLLEYEPEIAPQIEPLMGWTSSSDMKSQLKLEFGTKEEAIAYAEKHGIAFRLEEWKPAPRITVSYSDNFKSTRHDLWTH